MTAKAPILGLCLLRTSLQWAFAPAAPSGAASASAPAAVPTVRTASNIRESAGGVSVHVHLTSPLSRGLFQQAIIRLLRSSIGPRVALIGQQESGVQRVAKPVSWVREHFAQPMAVDALADLAHMSVSSFHQHFKAVTSMTPLQYRKVLRLHEARRLMLARMLDAGSAGRQVGYLSASQFGREYTRLLGSAPTRDIARLRQDGVPADEGAR